MTSGRRSSTSVRNSSRRRASPSTVTCNRSVGCCAGSAFGATGRRAGADLGASGGRLAVRALRVAVGDLDDVRRRRRGGGLREDRAAQPGPLPDTGRRAQVGERQHDVRYRAGPLVRSRAHPRRTRRATRPRIPPPRPWPPTRSGCARDRLRTWSQLPPGCGRRSPSGVSRRARTRLGIEVGVAPT